MSKSPSLSMQPQFILLIIITYKRIIFHLLTSNLVHTFVKPYPSPYKTSIGRLLAIFNKMAFAIFDAKLHENGSPNKIFTRVLKNEKFYTESKGAHSFLSNKK